MRDGDINQRTQTKLRSGIKAAQLIKKLESHVLRSAKMTATQVRAAEILLRKVTPDLTAQTLATDSADVPLLQIVKPSKESAA